MIVPQFLTKIDEKQLHNGAVSWSSPSNIALVKYWGKKAFQMPRNQSISFTLEVCRTTTKLSFNKLDKPSKGFSFEVLLDGKRKTNFEPKIEQFFKRIENYLPFLNDFHFKIETSNSFPHSSGIASSASGMSALALCLMSIEKQLNPEEPDTFFYKKASFLARLGSGSACRSIDGDLVVWGEHPDIEGSSDLFGVKYPYKIHDHFKNYQDTILLVDKGEKQVSSTLGHNLMNDHLYAQTRFEQAKANLSKIKTILETGNLEDFIALVESEALTLHGMMMTSRPYFILMKPNTLEIINKIWAFRKQTGLPICFTLDAGANVHVLYPERDAASIYEFIKSELVAYCQNGHYICDRVGFGAKQL